MLCDIVAQCNKSIIVENIPVDISGTIVGESPDCLLLPGTVVGGNPDRVYWDDV